MIFYFIFNKPKKIVTADTKPQKLLTPDARFIEKINRINQSGCFSHLEPKQKEYDR